MSQTMIKRTDEQIDEQHDSNTVNSVSPEPAGNTAINPKPRLGPNRTLPFQPPKVMTKSALLRDAQLRDHLRKEFLAMQAAVRATEIAIPFVFYDGINVPGGVCRVKKGDHVWAYLDKARKVGARNGVRGGGDRSKKQWARVGVDDLLLVRGGIIVPHVCILNNSSFSVLGRGKTSYGARLIALFMLIVSSITSSTISSSTKPSASTVRSSTTPPKPQPPHHPHLPMAKLTKITMHTI